MHNRKKLDQPLSEAALNALKVKCETYGSLLSLVGEKRKSHDYSGQTSELLGKILRMNPDYYSLWNYRREILLSNIPELEKPEKKDNSVICEAELKLSADAIVKNPKCYGAWFHRIWVANHFVVNFEKELELCKQFLLEDQRNFHCWNYRRYIVDYCSVANSVELEFSKIKIQENFSNYSAFHHRSVFIKKEFEAGVYDSMEKIKELVENEFGTVENAVYTEPDDQSGWWYQQFLLSWLSKDVVAAKSQDPKYGGVELVHWYVTVLEKQLLSLHELKDMESHCRWIYNSILLINQALLAEPYVSCIPNAKALQQEREDILRELMEVVDVKHANRYKYLLAADAM